MGLYAIAAILVTIGAGDISILLKKLLCLLCTVVSVAASQTTKQTPFREQEDLHNRVQEDSCARNVASGDVFTSEGASGSPGPSSPSQRDRSQRPSFGCGNCTFHSYIENGCPHPIPKTSSFPCVDVSGLTPEQKQELRSRLRVESQDIMFKFQQPLSTVYESLCDRKIPVNKLITHLLSLGAFDPVSKDSQKPLLKTFFQELRNADSIEDVLWVIRDYFSFFNYHVIEHIVNGLGTPQDKVELQNYEKHFHQYSKRRIYECPPIFGPISDADHALLDLKVDSAYEQFTVEELENFQYRLSKLFGVSPQSVLRLCRVDEGCLQLIFQVPSFVQQEIFPLSSEQERALAAEGVIRLTCGDYKFAAKVCSYCVLTHHWCMAKRFACTGSNLTDVSNYSDNFANYFLNSNCTIHSKLLQWLVYSIYPDRTRSQVKFTVRSRSQMYQVSVVQVR